MRQLVWHVCDQSGCSYKAKQAGHLKTHLSDVHGIGVVWHVCDQPNCSYKAKHAGNLIKHKAFVHDTGVVWHVCDQSGCSYKAKQASNLKIHKAFVHDIGVVWHVCDQPNCSYKTKQAGKLKRHLSGVHGIGVVWHVCDQPNCSYKAKQAVHLKQHLSDVHDIGVVWHVCDQPNCSYKSKKAVHLKRHLSSMHDIGQHTCAYCMGNRNSSIPFEGTNGVVSNICRGCYNKATGKNSRAEKQWSDYLDEHIGTAHLLASDRSMRGIGGCQLYRPDKLYASPELVVIAECDEHQHAYNCGDYTCDEKRISDLFDEFDGTQLVVIRWNPDSYKPASGAKKTKQERLDKMVEVFRSVLQSPPEDMIHIFYLYFDANNPRLSVHLPHTLIY